MKDNDTYTFDGTVMEDNIVWQRYCLDCKKVQPDQKQVGERCFLCGGPCYWEPKK